MNGIDERLRGGLGADHPLPSPDLDIAMSRLLRRAQRRRWARRAGAATVPVAVAAVVVGIVLTGPWHPRGQGDPDQHEILTPPGARPRILEAGVGRFVHPAPLAPGNETACASSMPRPTRPWRSWTCPRASPRTTT